MKKHIFIFIFAYGLIISETVAQHNDFWLIDDKIGIDFSQTPPLINRDVSINREAYCFLSTSSICDSQGMLQFYTAGNNVYNRNFEIIENGENLEGKDTHAGQSKLFIPTSYKIDEILLIIAEWPNALSERSRFYASLIDPNANEGLGKVEESYKDVLLGSQLTSRMALLQGECGKQWLVTHERVGNQFLSFPIDSTGIGTPIVSEMGRMFREYTEAYGNFAAANNSNIFVCTYRFSPYIDVFEVDLQSGEVSLLHEISVESDVYSYNSFDEIEGGVFSSNDSLFYIDIRDDFPGVAHIVQYDLSSNSTETIQQSARTIITSSERWGDMMYQVDKEIILFSPIPIAINSTTQRISAILQPDKRDQDCEFVINYMIIEKEEAYCYESNAVHINVTVPEAPKTMSIEMLGGDTLLCDTNNLDLMPTMAGDRYLWQDGSTNESYNVTSSGIFWAKVMTGTCTYIDTVVVDFQSNTELEIQTQICEGELYQFASTSLDSSGVFIDSLISHTGCDSIIILELLVLPTKYGDTTYAELNSQEPYQFAGMEFDSEGINEIFYTGHNGCDSIVYLHLTNEEVVILDHSLRVIPNIFSPNNDGVNDSFVLDLPEDLTIEEIAIYDRWGSEIYEIRENNEGEWNGKIKGQDAPSGVYFYRVLYRDERGDRGITSGDVTLIR